MKKKIILIGLIVIGVIVAFSLNAISGIEDDKVQKNTSNPKPELNTANNTDAKIVSVSTDDTTLTGKAKSNEKTTLTPIETATSIASGMIASGTTDKSVVMATLVSYGYEKTEAEIAYAKASTSDIVQTSAVTTTAASGSEPAAATTTATTGSEPSTATANTTNESVTNEPTIDPATRVQQDSKPTGKFQVSSFNANQNEDIGNTGSWDNTPSQGNIDTAKAMLNEGYTVDQIAQGFSENGYNSKTSASIMKEAGISSEDAYKALSNIAVKDAEAKVDANTAGLETRPTEKFKTGSAEDPDKQKQDAKQSAIKQSVEDLSSAGYEVTGTLDTAVQDLKNAGMSAQDAKDFLISKVADNTQKPGPKFRNWNESKTTYGDGEVSLATAMLKSGYSSADVTAAFETGSYGNSEDTSAFRSVGNYSYSAEAAKNIVAAAGNNITPVTATNAAATNPENANQTNNTEQDILRRNTQAIPI